jgi:microcystin-dependent protein
LRDRFVVGAGSGYAVAATGGEAAHTLTLTEIPAPTHAVDPPSAITSTNGSHSHSVSARDAGTNGSYIGEDNGSGSWHDVSTTASGDHSHSVDIPAFNSGSSGGGAAHNNLPPYYALAFIMKL